MAEVAFLRAASAGNLQGIKDIVECLKKKKISSTAFRDADNSTALHLSAMGGHTAISQFLIEHHDHKRLDPKNLFGYTLYHYLPHLSLKFVILLASGQDNIIEPSHYCSLLIGAGCMVQRCFFILSSSLHFRIYSHSWIGFNSLWHGETPLYLAVMNGHDETAIYFIKRGADVMVKSDLGFTLLHQASKLGQIDLMNTLIEKGVNIEAGAGHCGTPLFCAAGSGKLEALELLLNHNAKLNTSTADFLSPLVAAASVGSLPCVEALVQAGVNLDDISISSENLTGPNAEVYAFLHAKKEESVAKVTKKARKKIVSSNSICKNVSLLSDEAIKKELEKMLADGEIVFFSKWSCLQMRLFYKSTLNSLERPAQIFGIYDDSIKSVIFDVTDASKAQASFLRAICCYRAWQFSGTDLAYQFGAQGPKVCESRKDDTFVFWFRNKQDDVGAVINGQAIWTEGFLRRRYDEEEDEFIYSPPIQFRNEDMKANLEKNPTGHQYFMVAEDLDVVDYGGNYKGSVTDLNLHIKKLKAGIRKIINHVKDDSFQKTCHYSADRLVLYSTESGKNDWVFQYTMFSLNPDLPLDTCVTVPACLNATVVKHKKVSRRALLAIKGRIGRIGEYQKDEEYQIVRGAPFRVLSQVISAYTIFAREVILPTNLFLEEEVYEKHLESCLLMENSCTYIPDQIQPEESEQVKETKILEKCLRRGTLFDEKVHGGHEIFKGPLCWPMPQSPCSKKRWYYYKVIKQEGSSETLANT